MGFFERMFGKTNVKKEKPEQTFIDPSWEQILLPINRFEKKTGIALETELDKPLSPQTATTIFEEAKTALLKNIPEVQNEFNDSWQSIGDINLVYFKKGLQHPDTQKKFDLLEELFKLKAVLSKEMGSEEREPKTRHTEQPIPEISQSEKAEKEYNSLRNSAKNFLAPLERLTKNHENAEKITDLKTKFITLLSGAHPTTIELNPDTKDQLIDTVKELYLLVSDKSIDDTINEMNSQEEIPPQTDQTMLDTNTALLLSKIEKLK